jgi:hypothetical protein
VSEIPEANIIDINCRTLPPDDTDECEVRFTTEEKVRPVEIVMHEQGLDDGIFNEEKIPLNSPMPFTQRSET